jgi:hypothetical protein
LIKVGDRVRIVDGYHRGVIGTVTAELNFGGGNDWRVDFDNSRDWSYFATRDLELLGDKRNNGAKDGCTCGCSAVGSPRHSYYCDLFKEE